MPPEEQQVHAGWQGMAIHHEDQEDCQSTSKANDQVQNLMMWLHAPVVDACFRPISHLPPVSSHALLCLIHTCSACLLQHGLASALMQAAGGLANLCGCSAAD